MTPLKDDALETLAIRERFRDAYWTRRDPIADARLRWRAQTFRHMVHCLPGQRILELGSGEGRFTRALARVTRGENAITAATFQPEVHPSLAACGVDVVGVRDLTDLPRESFDFLVAHDLLDQASSDVLLQLAHDVLKPGGEMVLYESNPWNAVLMLRRFGARLLGRPDPRRLLSRPALYEHVSEIGFVRVFVVFNDFLFRPLTRSLSRRMHDLSVLLENAPYVRTLAGAILLHAQKPPRMRPHPAVSLAEHASLRGQVSVVVPCHDEEGNVEVLVRRLCDHYGEYLQEIVLVEDGSTDRTREIVLALAAADPRIRPVLREAPNGVGLALRDGLHAARGAWVLTLDCDFQHLCPELRDLFDSAAEGWDVTVGSRFSRHSVLLNYPFAKIVANRGFHVLAQLLLLRRFRDLTNNLKLMRREVVDELLLLEPGFAVNVETGLQPLLAGRSVREVPISWVDRTSGMGRSSFRLARVGRGYLRVLLHLWMHRVLRRGRYRGLARRRAMRSTRRGEVELHGAPPIPPLAGRP